MGIVIVNYGSHTLVEQNLAPLEPLPRHLKVIIVDNFSSTAESAAVTDVAEQYKWHLVQNSSNLGFGAAVNVGVRRGIELGCETFLLLNPDASVTFDVLDQLRLASLADPLALISPSITRPDGSSWFTIGRISIADGGLRPWNLLQPGRSYPWVSGACVAVHSRLWGLMGGFDDDYFLYWEDVDLSFRCAQVGGQVIARRDLTVSHDVGGTQGGATPKSPVYYYYNCRNRLLFASKHLSRRDKLRWVMRTPIDVRRVLRRGGRKQYLRPWRVFWPALKGSISGLIWMITHQDRGTPGQSHRPRSPQ